MVCSRMALEWQEIWEGHDIWKEKLNWRMRRNLKRRNQIPQSTPSLILPSSTSGPTILNLLMLR